MTLFYDANIQAKTQEFVFSREESKHLAKVLRKTPGELITVTNGKGLEWSGKLLVVTPSKTSAKLEDAKQHNASKNQIHLAIAPTKNNNRMEWMLEKLTELGIASITPIKCDYSERKLVKTERFEKIIIAGLKQSQQFFLPQINELVPFSEFINRIKFDQTFIAHCEDLPKQKLLNLPLSGAESCLMIGPEGDFSSTEIASALQKNIIPVSLGQQRYRTETAGLLGCHTLFIKQQQYTNA